MTVTTPPAVTLTIIVEGLPDKRLEPNARVDHWQKARAAKADRERGGWAVKEAFSAEAREDFAEWARRQTVIRYRVEIGLPRGAKKRDSDNVAIWAKSLRDGIADLLCGGWDGNWQLVETVQVRDRETLGYVRFDIEVPVGDEGGLQRGDR